MGDPHFVGTLKEAGAKGWPVTAPEGARSNSFAPESTHTAGTGAGRLWGLSFHYHHCPAGAGHLPLSAFRVSRDITMSSIVRFHVFVGQKAVQSYVTEEAARAYVLVYNAGNPKPDAKTVQVLLPEPRREGGTLSYT